jgi:FdrA protein
LSEAALRGAVRRNAYFDSISLLQVTSAVAALPGVQDAALVMATELNCEVLRESGLLFVDKADQIGPNDLLIALRASDSESADAALQAAEALLAERRAPSAASTTGQQRPRTIRGALRSLPDANLAVISVPGPFAAAEARQALAAGLHVFLFSDNVALEDEIELKRRARALGLLVMGPDCGTAIVNGVGLGFANVVRRGRIGLIGASGTGLQEVTTLLDRAGLGISHAIGTGGRDFLSAVGAITTMQALELLRDDPATEVIVLISKPPAPDVAERVLRAAASSGKPVVACLLGARVEAPPGVQLASNLYQAARLAAGSAGAWPAVTPADLPRLRRQPGQNQVCGLYGGGTLCDEAALAVGHGHQLIDFGDDRYTRGRAHPMIDPGLRNQAILAAADDPRVAVLLLDVVLGFGAHPDPAGVVAPVVREAVERAARSERQLAVLAHVVGSDGDPQNLTRQEDTLRAVGVHLFGSNHHAAVAAGLLLEQPGP